MKRKENENQRNLREFTQTKWFYFLVWCFCFVTLWNKDWFLLAIGGIGLYYLYAKKRKQRSELLTDGQ